MQSGAFGGCKDITIAWMSVEAAVPLFAAWRASSPALLAFGGDSAIELFSAVVVLWRFRASDAHEDAERRAARVAGALPDRMPPVASRKVERASSTRKQWLDIFRKCPRQKRIRFQTGGRVFPIFLVPALAFR